jgi:hypothetical protein
MANHQIFDILTLRVGIDRKLANIGNLGQHLNRDVQ